MEKEFSTIAADFIDAYCRTSHEKFLEQMRLMHRTYQQLLAGMVLGWLNDYVNYRTDDRNKSSVAFVRELRALHCETTGDEGFKDKFPLI
jgi:hypothetical protein